MDKTTYETYEYLPTSSAATEADQFFIVQDDGTFLINRQVQYVTQVEETKEVLDNEKCCVVYDITPQQFFVDVNNSGELISTSENFMLPDGSNNLYANSYLLQTVSSAGTDQMDEDVDVDQFKQTDVQMEEIDVINGESKQNCTEITLSDNQYNMLEQKGWVLLETNDKIFILDTLGLHDITTNEELIQQLRTENQSNTSLENDENSSKEVTSTIKFENIATEITSSHQEAVEIVIRDDEISPNEGKLETRETIKVEKCDGKTLIDIKTDTVSESEKEDTDNVTKIHKEGSTIKIKTKLSFKDIPKKIVLGKTTNGKQLVAKVVNSSRNDQKNATKKLHIKPKQTTPVQEPKPNQSLLQEWQFESLVQQALNRSTEIKNSPDHVAAAEDVISQLLQVPTFQVAVADHNLFITKVVRTKKGNIFSETIMPSIVSGRVISEGETQRFVHMPDLLQKLVVDSDSSVHSEDSATASTLPRQNKSNDDYVLHVHITETKSGYNTDAVSIALNRRQLPIIVSRNTKKRQPNKMFACSSCATIFVSEKDLTDHQEMHSVDADDPLTIDTDKLDKVNEDIKLNPYYIIKTDKGTLYACMQCSLKFNRLNNCQRHVKTHSKQNNKDISHNIDNHKSISNNILDNDQVYKCKMCPSSYFHPSSLSKHIVTTHIKVNTN